jgi:hypothetical protein
MYIEFIYKWSFWDGLRTLMRLSSFKRCHEWIPTIVSTLISYRIRSHSMLNCTHLRGACFLAMTKPSNGVRPILIWETLYRFTSHVLCFQFCNIFATRLSPHQFEVATKGECEAIIHGIKCTLDFHPD